MNEYTKLIMHNYWKTFFGGHFGLICAVFMFWLAFTTTPNNCSNIGAIVIFCFGGTIGVCFWIYGILEYITYKAIFTNSSIALYKWKKQIKIIKTNDVKRIILFILNVRGGKVTEAIIIDDGSFLYEGGKPYKILSLKNVKNVSWIAIEYTKKRLQKIKALLPNCPIEKFDTADWID